MLFKKCGNISSGGGSGGGTLAKMLKSADNPNKVLNPVPESELGKTYQELNYSQKSSIRQLLTIRKADAEFLQEYAGRGNQSQSVRINNVKYTVEISATESGKVSYSLKKRQKKDCRSGQLCKCSKSISGYIQKTVKNKCQVQKSDVELNV